MKKQNPLVALVGAIAVMWLVFLGITTFASLIYKGLHQTPAPAPVVAVPVAPAEPAPSVAQAAPETAAAPAGIDLAAGEKAFKACKACHAAAKDGKNGTGPNLWSVVGRPIASAPDFKYSVDLSALSAQTWDVAALDSFLAKPKDFAKGTKMSFAGLKKPEDRANVIAWLASQSDTPQTPDALGLVVAPADAAGEPATEAPALPYADLAEDAVIEIAPVAYPEGVTYQNVPEQSDETIAGIVAKLAALEAEVPTLDYQRARYHPLHFPPAIAEASSEECLACHQEILSHRLRETSPAGVKAAESMAWYQTLDTYAGGQADFHWRHLESDFAKQVMKLDCNFCHKGNDPREETPDMMPGRAAMTAGTTPEFTLRKMVNPSETCLLCHGSMPDPVSIMGLPDTWPVARVDLETPEAPNGCLVCHAESFRTNRHQVNYLNAATIEELARSGTSDSCYGCHGGRQWYRISYPYTRHAWPLMDASTLPDWAATRPTETKPEHALPVVAD